MDVTNLLRNNVLVRNESTLSATLFDNLVLMSPQAGYYQLLFIDNQRLQQPAIASFVVVPGIVVIVGI